MARELSFFERYDFLLRRLHSFTGIMPVGVFLIAHLITNSSIVWGLLDARHQVAAGEGGHAGVVAYQHEVEFIHRLPFLLFIEIFGLWLPILFHSLYGFYIWKTGKSNVASYGWWGNWRYSLQRWSGWIGFLFIFYHVATLRWGWTFLVPGGTAWDGEFAASTLAAALQGGTGERTTAGLIVSIFYMLGVTLLVFHLANGLWTAAITWGLTISNRAQQRWAYACFAIGAGLMLAGWAGVVGFATLDQEQARRSEESYKRHGIPATPATPPASLGASDPSP